MPRREARGHAKIKNRVKEVFSRAGLVVDTEVHFDLDGDGQSDYSFDVCVFCQEGNEQYIIGIECKDTNNARRLSRDVAAWSSNRNSIITQAAGIRIVSSTHHTISKKHFRGLSDIKIGYVFGDRLPEESAQNVKRKLKKVAGFFWDSEALSYFEKLSLALGNPSRFEIFRELGLFESIYRPVIEGAVQIKQQGFPPMYLTGMSPQLLLRIGYVARRISRKPSAYQRAITKERIEDISKFFGEHKKLLLPNSIILAFDSDPEVQKKISFQNNLLKFPYKFCSAWIIDGQHRIYGFGRQNFRDWSQATERKFQLPVVVFRNLSEALQNKTFVNINYYQKKIDPTLFCDLSTFTKDLKNELTWPSLLGSELNQIVPWKNRIKISENDRGKPVTLSSFVRYALLEYLLGYNKKSKTYSGPLYTYASFDTSLSFDHPKNKAAFSRQLQVLKKFFLAVEAGVNLNHSRNRWEAFSTYATTKATGVNSLLLVLYKILEAQPNLSGFDFSMYLRPLKDVNFGLAHVAQFGGGWKGFGEFANHIIKKLNKANKVKLATFS